jgi:hypothetical protein
MTFSPKIFEISHLAGGGVVKVLILEILSAKY